MIGAVAPDSVATAPQERGWRWFVIAIAAMVAVTSAPLWTPSLALMAGMLRLLLPVEQFAVLVLVSIAACAVVGWWMGGRGWVALSWCAMTGWVLWQLSLSTNGYGAFLRGWSLCLGGAFGLISLTTRSRPVLSRSLAAVALTCVVVTIGFAGRSGDAGPFDGARRMFANEYQRRVQESLTHWKRRTESPAWQSFATRLPAAATRADRLASTLGTLSGEGLAGNAGKLTARAPLLMLAPALLGLESLLALCLGWAAYHRISRVRIGPPMSALRDLRFNDQMVWGLVVGATVLLLPTLVEWWALGANLIFFFAVLYALRGFGVVMWWIPDRVAALLPLALLVLVPILGALEVLVLIMALTFAVGLGDTWRDFRAGAGPRRTGSLR